MSEQSSEFDDEASLEATEVFFDTPLVDEHKPRVLPKRNDEVLGQDETTDIN